jgi:rubrerythrin
VSRLPRAQEYLKTGFNAEAASAARYRAAAFRAAAEGHPKLAEAWRALAAEKDELARLQLEAAGQVRGGHQDLEAALAEERYENDSLYPRMSGEVDAATAAVFSQVVSRQQQHLARLDSLLDAKTRSQGDISG